VVDVDSSDAIWTSSAAGPGGVPTGRVDCDKKATTQSLYTCDISGTELFVVVCPSVDVSIVDIPHRHQKTALLATYVSQTQSSQSDNCTLDDVGIGFGNHEIVPY